VKERALGPNFAIKDVFLFIYISSHLLIPRYKIQVIISKRSIVELIQNGTSGREGAIAEEDSRTHISSVYCHHSSVSCQHYKVYLPVGYGTGYKLIQNRVATALKFVVDVIYRSRFRIKTR